MGKFFERHRQRRRRNRVERLGSVLVDLRWKVLTLGLEQTLGTIDACMALYLSETLAAQRPAATVAPVDAAKSAPDLGVELPRRATTPGHGEDSVSFDFLNPGLVVRSCWSRPTQGVASPGPRNSGKWRSIALTWSSGSSGFSRYSATLYWLLVSASQRRFL